jgi:hypothetical protein
LRQLVSLHREGCDIDVIVSNADGDILAGLASAGIPVRPFFKRRADGRPQVIVHSKFWLVDARSRVTGIRTRLTYAGSSNWRGDEQYSDDLLLRIADDGVYDAYSDYWKLIRSRVVSDQDRPATDTVAPATALTASPEPNAAGWNRSDVGLRIAASDGHNVGASGLRRLHVEMAGAQQGSWDFPGETAGLNVQELTVSAEGTTTVTYFAEDAKGNRGREQTRTVLIDKTAPSIAGVPQNCELWPPDHSMVHVADVTATDAGAGLAGLSLSVTGDPDDVAVSGGSVSLRAEKDPRGAARTYAIHAVATDAAGNVARDAGACVVPHSRGGRRP